MFNGRSSRVIRNKIQMYLLYGFANVYYHLPRKTIK